MFRGIRQNGTGLATWPYFDLGIGAFEGDGGLKSVGINVGTWNSLHSERPGGWYESDCLRDLCGPRGSAAASVSATTYTSYTSPERQLHAREGNRVQAVVRRQRRARLGGVEALCASSRSSWRPSPAGTRRTVAWNGGRYLELGVAPGAQRRAAASLALPVKVGLSTGDYYELGGVDNKFGFFSVGGIVTVPLGGTHLPGTCTAASSTRRSATPPSAERRRRITGDRILRDRAFVLRRWCTGPGPRESLRGLGEAGSDVVYSRSAFRILGRGGSRNHGHGFAGLSSGRGDGRPGRGEPVQLPRHSPEQSTACRSGRTSTSGSRRSWGDGGLKTVGVNVGTWNAFNTQIDGLSTAISRRPATSGTNPTSTGRVGLGFGAPALAFTYTSYTSPADLFAHVKELAVKLSVTTARRLGRARSSRTPSSRSS